jgi:hypothetical protein
MSEKLGAPPETIKYNFAGISDILIYYPDNLVPMLKGHIVQVNFVGVEITRRDPGSEASMEERLRHIREKSEGVIRRQILHVPIERLKKAAAYFRSSYCKGRAF